MSATSTRKTLDLLRKYESRNITFMREDGRWPMVWESARGVHVRDPEGRRYLDLTAAFGVAAAGHANPRVVRAGQRQMAKLAHAMGDVHPHPVKARLARELSRLTFERWLVSGRRRGSRERWWGRTIFCGSGFEAVEAALKTARLATGKPGVVVFEGAYHGLGYGALNATHRDHFRAPFTDQLRQFGRFVPFPVAPQPPPDKAMRGRGRFPDGPKSGDGELGAIEASIQRLFSRYEVGAILVEPIQVRGGIRIPPPEFLPRLRRLCDEHRALLILDEIYTGFGRTGKWFACEHAATTPDLICLGKALTGGFPLSACVGRSDLMDAAWPPSNGEAIHTSTFLGNPVGCAMALAQIEEIRAGSLVQRSADLGGVLLAALWQIAAQRGPVNMRAAGLGLLAGLELRMPDGRPATATALGAIEALLHRGFILLPEGEHGNIISFSPPLTISKAQLESSLRALVAALREVTSGGIHQA
jgi:4-aminobutyrate aminotransferase-like enzyme